MLSIFHIRRKIIFNEKLCTMHERTMWFATNDDNASEIHFECVECVLRNVRCKTELYVFSAASLPTPPFQAPVGSPFRIQSSEKRIGLIRARLPALGIYRPDSVGNSFGTSASNLAQDKLFSS